MSELDGAEQGFFRRYRIVFLYYLTVFSTTGAFISYGIEWQRFAEVPDSYRYGQMTSGLGKVTSLTSSGFGNNKDYVIRLDDKHEFVIGSSIYKPKWETDQWGEIPVSSLIKVGDEVRLRATRGRPIVLDLSVKIEGNTFKEVINYDMAQRRWRIAHEKAKRIGEENIETGKLFLFMALGLHFVFWTGRRLLRKKNK